MGKKSAEDQFHQTLISFTETLNETLTLLNEPAPTLEKVPWTDVRKSGEQIAKHATTAGTLWSGQKLTVAAGRENIKVFCDSLQGFLLLCHGSTVGAGPTLLNAIRFSAKQVVDSSLQLLSKAISLCVAEVPDTERKTIIPQLAGCVWEACNALKKTPTTNSTAIGRNLTQVAASVKDVIREMQELKEAEVPIENGGARSMLENRVEDDVGDRLDTESSCSLEIDDKLSREEMEIAKSVKGFICSILKVLKELLYIITDISKRLKDNDTIYLYPLERISELCQEMSVQVDELGACCYPPQEVQQMKVSMQKIHGYIDGLQCELQKIEGSLLEGFKLATEELEKCSITLKNILDSSNLGTAEGEC
jgi:hypothetical protein